MTSIDLNADIGEGDPYDAELLQIVSSCNIACGGHAGDDDSMRATIVEAQRNDVAIGAHPSYPDREGFGRRQRFLLGDALHAAVRQQILALRVLARDEGAELRHVKPHGALYNDATHDPELAGIVARAAAEALPATALVGMPGTELEAAAARCSLGFIAEGFIDRAYQSDGRLMPRSEPGAVHRSPELMAAQALSLVGKVQTLCVHGDTPGAAMVARFVRDALQQQGVVIRAVSR